MFQLHPNALFTSHVGQAGGRDLSPRLWSQVNGQGMAPDGQAIGYCIADDFLSFGGTVTTNGGTYASFAGGYKSYEDTGNSIAQIVASGGVVRITTDTTDNDESWIQSGYSAGTLGAISATAGSDKKMIFEARFRLGQIVTQNVFVGLAEEGCAAADFVSDAGAIGDKDQIGFQILEGASTTLKFVYKKAGQTAQTVISSLKTVAASTWYKVGFVYDPAAPTSKRIKVYLDNVEQSTYVTGTNIAAATFPADQQLAFLAGVKNGAAAATALDLDWWAFWQAG